MKSRDHGRLGRTLLQHRQQELVLGVGWARPGQARLQHLMAQAMKGNGLCGVGSEQGTGLTGELRGGSGKVGVPTGACESGNWGQRRGLDMAEVYCGMGVDSIWDVPDWAGFQYSLVLQEPEWVWTC